MSPLLQVRDLATEFATRDGVLRAVQGVSFDLARGEVLGLVGESGSGKSVTGFSILGLIDAPGRIAGGSVCFDGRELVGLPESQLRALRGKRIAMIFQDPMMTLNPVLSIETQMVETVLAHEPVSRSAARERALAALAQVGIADPASRLPQYPHQFSGGMRQRVAIAIALLNRPDLIIADEPTTALDVTVQAQILRLLLDLQRDLGLAILLITHDLGVVARVAHRVSVMYAGEVVESAPVEALFAHPTHPYTSGLLGCVPVPGKVARGAPLGSIAGVVPRLGPEFRGCGFRDRCAHAAPACAQTIARRAAGPRHDYLCRLEPGLAGGAR